MVDGKFRRVKRPNFLHTDGKQAFFVANAMFYGVYYECIYAGAGRARTRAGKAPFVWSDLVRWR